MRLSPPPLYCSRLEFGLETMTEIVLCWAQGMQVTTCPFCPHQAVCIYLDRWQKEAEEENERDKKSKAP